jgi:hypothetical protein
MPQVRSVICIFRLITESLLEVVIRLRPLQRILWLHGLIQLVYVTQNTVVGAVNELGGGMAVTDSGKIVLSGTVEYSSAINEDVAIIRMRPISVNPSAVQEVSLNEVMRVSPNPFTTELMVVSTQAADAELTDLTGRRIAGFSVVEGINRFAIDNIPAGAYLFRVPGYGAIRLIRP